MPEFSLLPVEHQPDFSTASFVPVDHDPFSADRTIQQASTQHESLHQPLGAGLRDVGSPASNIGEGKGWVDRLEAAMKAGATRPDGKTAVSI